MLAVAQTEVTVADGGTQGQDIPIHCNYNYTYSEQIYLQSEINHSGNISSYRLSMMDMQPEHKISLIFISGHTSKTSFGSKTDWITSDNMTLVYSGSMDLPNTLGWVSIALTIHLTITILITW